MVDAHANFAYSTVATPPSPANSGPSLTVPTGEGTRFGAAPFNATIWPAGAQSLASNSTIVRVTAVVGDTLSITHAQEGTAARTILAGDQIQAGITAKTLTDVEGASLLRDQYFRASIAKFESIPRTAQINTAQPTSTGTLHMQAIALPAGVVISTITFASTGTGAGTPTHWWYGLYDANRVQLAVTADQLTAAFPSVTAKTLNIATTAAGAASSFTTTTEGLYYVGFMMVATTMPTLAAATIAAAVSNLTPVLFGSSDSSQTTPPAFPKTASAISASAALLYATVG